MITINNSIELLTASITEAYSGDDKVLVLRFPTSEFSNEQASEYAKIAEDVTITTADKIYKYFVSGVVKKTTYPYYTDMQLKIVNVEITDDIAKKLVEAENALAQISEAIREGVNSIDS